MMFMRPIWLAATSGRGEPEPEPEPFDPISVPGVIADWDVDDAINNSGASSLPDRSGNGNDVAQATAGARLAIVSGDAHFNDHDSLQGAVGDFLQRAALVGGNVAQPHTKYAVIRTDADVTSDQHIFSTGVSGTDRGDVILNGGRFRIYAGAFVSTTASVLGDTAGILKVVFNGASSSIEWRPQGGSLLSATGNAGTQALAGVTLMAYPGPTSAFLGKGSRFIQYSGVISGDNDTAIKAYLTQRYGLQ